MLKPPEDTDTVSLAKHHTAKPVHLLPSSGCCHLKYVLPDREDVSSAVGNLERTRSGWVKGLEEGTSLRSLHVAQTPHMGVSIPAVAYPLKMDGTADLDVKPQPVTLFFGIIDFLQASPSCAYATVPLPALICVNTCDISGA